MSRVPSTWCVITLSMSACGGGAIAQPNVPWEWFEGRAQDGSPLVGELGHLLVPENRSNPNGALVELAFVRYRTTNPNPDPPIFYLAGGPGGSGVELVGSFATHPQMRFLEHADVIAVDQRGTGFSRPNLAEPTFEFTLPLDRAVGRDETVAALADAWRRCCEHWTRQGVDLSSYDTVESARDLDEVRAALGLERIVLFGSSYGSHLGLTYLRLHPERVARAIFAKVEGPDHTWKRPGTIQRHLRIVHDLVAADAIAASQVPDLIGAVSELLRRLEREPVTVSLAESTDATRVVVGPYDLQRWVAESLAEVDEIARLPQCTAAFERGEWSALGEFTRAARRGKLPSAMSVAMDCASGASPERLEDIEREARDSANLLADAIEFPLIRDLCGGTCSVTTLDDEFRAPFRSDVPVLFVSGTLDARTPPANVDEIASTFTRAAHVVVENAGHESRELMSPEYRRLLQAFLRGERVESCTLSLPGVRFVPDAGTATSRP